MSLLPTPGAHPPFLAAAPSMAGRQAELAAFAALLAEGGTTPVIVIEGLAGMGRRSLLMAFRDLARHTGYAASSPVPAHGSARAGDLADRAKASLTGPDAHRPTGAVMLFERLNALPPDELAHLLEGFAHQPRTLVAASGLPGLGQAVEAALPGVTMRTLRLARLTQAESLDTLASGAFTPAAAALIAERADGVPAFLSIRAEITWRETAARPVDAADVDRTETAARGGLRESFYEPALARATRAERAYLAGGAQIADASGAFSTGALEALLQATNPVRPDGGLRRSLLAKGLLFVPARGSLAFAHPGMAEYLRQEAVA